MGILDSMSLSNALQPIADAIQALADAVDRVAAISEKSVQIAEELTEQGRARDRFDLDHPKRTAQGPGMP